MLRCCAHGDVGLGLCPGVPTSGQSIRQAFTNSNPPPQSPQSTFLNGTATASSPPLRLTMP